MRCRNRLEDGSERRRKEGETRVRKIGAGKKAQPVKYMSCKHGGVSSIPRTQVQELGMVVFACNPNPGELETSRSLELSSWLASLDESANSIEVRDAVS